MNPHARLGAFVLAALLLLAFATGKIGDIAWPKQDNNIVESLFDDTLGLDIQSPVLMAGVKVGIVQEIGLRGGHALVRIALNPDVKLPSSTRASIIGRGLVGEKNLALTADPNDTELLAEGAIIPSDPSGDINTFIAKASGITDDIRALTGALSSGIGDGKGKQSLQQLIKNSGNAAEELASMIKENRQQIRSTTESMNKTMHTLEVELPAILRELRQTSRSINQLVSSHRKDLDAFASELPKTAKAGREFFESGTKATEALNASMIDNRENLYRTLFELRLASENLEAFSDDIRRNPWKLMKEKPEIKASKRARQEKMEELLMTTGRMGIAPSSK
ncbi:phospholipid/cholesterol/gamma-HCH transport system substrate-binding protein [Mariprofundus micogutta]|uniref:Phospholipid/cholesterol/gamma-HCH transport system substrate-binding protein n=1 Tax=Mariprofundus micogutta TaxID=1921010 RepID=A0A1L8CLF3_9PROT|nr:MlaD family protein [Mariprofundus micogutta]GAV19731.1 phospholipid/cholesterol/gamma-HCH transport system substrate-binding protein [Mariprofundus micogutta]